MFMNAKARESFSFLLGRRSIRVYTPGAVSDESVKTLLEAAMAAPSEVAKDPWRFVVVRDKAVLKRITGALPNGQMLASAALGIAVCGDLDAAHDRQLSYMLQDCSAAIEETGDKLMLKRHGDFLTLGGKFPRLTKKDANARLKEIKKLLLAI